MDIIAPTGNIEEKVTEGKNVKFVQMQQDITDVVTEKEFGRWPNTEELEAQAAPTPMGKLYNSLNSFRGMTFGSADMTRPWRHLDSERYLGQLGAGTHWPMPPILSPETATKLTREWKSEVIEAWTHLTTRFCRYGDVVKTRLENLPEEKMQDLIQGSWSAVLKDQRYRSIFGDSTVPQRAHSDWKLWVTHTKGTFAKRTFDDGPSVPVPTYSFSPDTLDTRPEFSAFATFCSQHRLAFQIPGLNMEFLTNRELLYAFICSRSLQEPAKFFVKDWDAMHIGRTGRLLEVPFCDATFMASRGYFKDPFFSTPQHIENIEAGFASYARLIIDPDKNIVHDKQTWAEHETGRVLGWGEGFLVLQAQGAITRFCMQLVESLLQDQSTILKSSLPPIPLSWPIKVRGLLDSVSDYWIEAAERDTETWPDSRLKRFLNSPKDWYKRVWEHLEGTADFTIIRQDGLSGSFQLTHDRGYDNGTDGDLLFGSHDELKSHIKILLKDPALFRRTMRDQMTMDHHYGWINGTSDLSGGAVGEEGQLPHLTDGDIDAKRALANDAIRRNLRMLFFSLEGFWVLSQMWRKIQGRGGFKADKDLQDKQRRRDYIYFICALRYFVEILYAHLREAGFVHALPAIREYTHRFTQPEKPGGSWTLPKGFRKNDRPARAVSLDKRGNQPTMANVDNDSLEFCVRRSLFLLEMGQQSPEFGIPSMAEVTRALAENLRAVQRHGDGSGSFMLNFLLDKIPKLLMLDRLMSHTVSFADHRICFHKPWSEVIKQAIDEQSGTSFVENFDDFSLEDGVTKDTLSDVHLLLGIKYMDDSTSEVSGVQARDILSTFLRELTSWMNKPIPQPQGYAAESRSEKAKKGNRANAQPDTNLPTFILSEYCGLITTCRPETPEPRTSPPEGGGSAGAKKREDGPPVVKQDRYDTNANHTPNKKGAQVVPKKLSSRDWEVVRDIFGDRSARDRGTMRYNQYLAAMTHLGFSIDRREGSRVNIAWTELSRLPKPKDTLSITMHNTHDMPLTGRDMLYIRNDMKKWGITETLIEEHYGEQADGPRAGSVQVLDPLQSRKRPLSCFLEARRQWDRAQARVQSSNRKRWAGDSEDVSEDDLEDEAGHSLRNVKRVRLS